MLKVFKEEFHEAIDSSKFDDKLKNNLKAITFSEEYLLEQGNLNSLWEKITLCVYRKEFPQIYEKVKKQIKNDFFKKTSISYYYKKGLIINELYKNSPLELLKKFNPDVVINISGSPYSYNSPPFHRFPVPVFPYLMS